jgi:hypothetical protein
MLVFGGSIDLKASLAPVVTIKARALVPGPDGLSAGPVTTVTYHLTVGTP